MLSQDTVCCSVVLARSQIRSLQVTVTCFMLNKKAA